MAQLIPGIKGTGEYIEASGNGSFENPYIPTVYVSNISEGTGGGTVSITGTLPSFTATPTFNIGTAPNLTFTNTSFIANAGTNLNTSLLALESGGNLAGINTKLPTLINGKIPVEAVVTSGNLTFTNTSFIANAGTNLNTSLLALESGGNLAGINSKLPTLINGKIPVDTNLNTSLLALESGGNLAGINSKLPTLINGKIPVEAVVTSGNLTFTNTSFIANAGTNLNTSLLALESGGNLAGINSKLPTLINGKIPVEAVVASGNLTFTNTSFIANAGTNLNTSLLALESGGNLAGINSKLPTLVNGKIPVEADLNTSLLALESGGNLAGINSKLPTLVNGKIPVEASVNVSSSSSSYLSSAIITRNSSIATTTYSQNDVYGGVFELTNIGSNGGFIFLSSLDIIFNISSLPSGMGAFTVFLYSSSPPSAIADNALFNISGSFSNGAMTLDRSVILSTSGFSLTAAVTRGGNTVAAELLNINQLFKLTTTSLWGYLVTNTGFGFGAGSTGTETAVIRARSFTP